MAAYQLVGSKTWKKQHPADNSISKFVARNENNDPTQVAMQWINVFIVSVVRNAEKKAKIPHHFIRGN